jgi:hypothetical protein
MVAPLPHVLGRPAGAAAVATVLTATMTAIIGCSAGAPSARGAGHGSAPAASHQSAATAQPPTGDHLASLLNTDVPPGYSVDTGATTALTNQPGALEAAPAPGFLTCQEAISGDPDITTFMGSYDFSFATMGIESNAGGNLVQGQLELAGFQAGDAVKAYDLELGIARKCHSFSPGRDDHSRLTVSTVPGLGDQNFYFIDRDVDLGEGPPPIMTRTVLFVVRVGNALAGIDSETTDGLMPFAEIEKLAQAEAAQLQHV